jgi:hypothetical protein
MPKRYDFYDEYPMDEEEEVIKSVEPLKKKSDPIKKNPITPPIIIQNKEYKNPWKALQSAKVNFLDVIKEQERENEIAKNPEYNEPSPKKNNILCFFEPNHNPQCKHSHSLKEWTPRNCKFDKTCKTFSSCIYIHKSLENNIDFLQRMFKLSNNPYSKNEHKFKKLYF